jgi:hypothetical protein
MAGPMPRMDPWMEQQWGNAHHSLITYPRGQIRHLPPPDLRARVEERVFVETSDGPERTIFPDLRVIEHASFQRASPRKHRVPSVIGRPNPLH